MQECTLFHTGVYESADGVVKDNKVYLKGDEGKLYSPEEMFMAREECENGLIQFMVEEKWGFADIYTGEIIIDPVWDYLGPFYHGYAHAALDIELEILSGLTEVIVEGGKHGYIGTDGEILIPIEYDAAAEIPYRDYEYLQVAKNGKYGLIDKHNKVIIPFKWDYLKTSYDHDLIFCGIEKKNIVTEKEQSEFFKKLTGEDLEPGMIKDKEPMYDTKIKWSVYDKEFNLVLDAELDEKPAHFNKYNTKNIKFGELYSKYYLLKIKNKYGVLCKDGRLISNIELTKEQAISLIKSIS